MKKILSLTTTAVEDLKACDYIIPEGSKFPAEVLMVNNWTNPTHYTVGTYLQGFRAHTVPAGYRFTKVEDPEAAGLR